MNIKELEIELKNARREVENLNFHIKEIEKQIKEKTKFKRANYDEFFYTICLIGGKMVVISRSEINDYYCNCCFESNNYFLTKERAQEVADKFNFLLRLERLKDEFCPDYIPNWNNENEFKYNICFDYNANKYYVDTRLCREKKNDVYFSIREVAEQVCNTLNKKLEHNNNQ